MIFYGTALLAGCVFAGMVLGQWIGHAAGIESDIGGVGLAMLLLIGTTTWLARRGRWTPAAGAGVQYWGDIYIPIVVAMAATQNVRGALSGGVLAVVAGAGGVMLCTGLVAALIRSAARRGGAAETAGGGGP